MATKTKSKTTSRNRPHSDRSTELKSEALTAVHIDVLRTLDKLHALSLAPATIGVICEVSGRKARHVAPVVHDLWHHGLVTTDPSSVDSENGRKYRLSDAGRRTLVGALSVASPVQPSQSGSFAHLTVRVPMSRSRQTPHGLMHSFACSHPECSQLLSPERLSAQDALNDAMDNGAAIVGNQIFHGRCAGLPSTTQSLIREVDGDLRHDLMVSYCHARRVSDLMMRHLTRMGVDYSQLVEALTKGQLLAVARDMARRMPVTKQVAKRRATKKAKR